MPSIHQLYRKREEEDEILQNILKESLQLKADTYFYKKKEELLKNLLASFQKQSKKLINLNDQKNKFLGMAAHELKNNVGIMQNYAELFIMLTKDGYKPEYQSFIETILQTAKETNQILNDFLDISAIENGKISTRIEEFRIEEVITRSCLLHEGMARTKDITLHLTANSHIPKMQSDPSKILQIVNNVISNAIKYSPEGSDIYINVLLNEGNVLLQVIDEGHGIPQDEVKKIFEPFAAISSEPTKGERKTGLGLFIVKKLVNILEGNVEVNSKIGEGTVFVVSLPLKIQAVK
jgi:signal transduction histidine kinase